MNAKTGYVYDGFSRESKTANMINAIIVQGGKNMPVNVLFQRVMEEQVKKVVKDIGNKVRSLCLHSCGQGRSKFRRF